MPKVKTIDYPVNIKYTFYRKDRIRCDLNGLIQAIDDILVKYGVIADDNFNIVVGHDFSRVIIDKENPRTEVEINEI
jgi:Holliday junction resolvase RusA-like endonuclease